MKEEPDNITPVQPLDKEVNPKKLREMERIIAIHSEFAHLKNHLLSLKNIIFLYCILLYAVLRVSPNLKDYR